MSQLPIYLNSPLDEAARSSANSLLSAVAGSTMDITKGLNDEARSAWLSSFSMRRVYNPDAPLTYNPNAGLIRAKDESEYTLYEAASLVNDISTRIMLSASMLFDGSSDSQRIDVDQWFTNPANKKFLLSQPGGEAVYYNYVKGQYRGVRTIDELMNYIAYDQAREKAKVQLGQASGFDAGAATIAAGFGDPLVFALSAGVGEIPGLAITGGGLMRVAAGQTVSIFEKAAPIGASLSRVGGQGLATGLIYEGLKESVSPDQRTPAEVANGLMMSTLGSVAFWGVFKAGGIARAAITNKLVNGIEVEGRLTPETVEAIKSGAIEFADSINQTRQMLNNPKAKIRFKSPYDELKARSTVNVFNERIKAAKDKLISKGVEPAQAELDAYGEFVNEMSTDTINRNAARRTFSRTESEGGDTFYILNIKYKNHLGEDVNETWIWTKADDGLYEPFIEGFYDNFSGEKDLGLSIDNDLFDIAGVDESELAELRSQLFFNETDMKAIEASFLNKEPLPADIIAKINEQINWIRYKRGFDLETSRGQVNVGAPASFWQTAIDVLRETGGKNLNTGNPLKLARDFVGNVKEEIFERFGIVNKKTQAKIRRIFSAEERGIIDADEARARLKAIPGSDRYIAANVIANSVIGVGVSLAAIPFFKNYLGPLLGVVPKKAKGPQAISTSGQDASQFGADFIPVNYATPLEKKRAEASIRMLLSNPDLTRNMISVLNGLPDSQEKTQLKAIVEGWQKGRGISQDNFIYFNARMFGLIEDAKELKAKKKADRQDKVDTVKAMGYGSYFDRIAYRAGEVAENFKPQLDYFAQNVWSADQRADVKSALLSAMDNDIRKVIGSYDRHVASFFDEVSQRLGPLGASFMLETEKIRQKLAGLNNAVMSGLDGNGGGFLGNFIVQSLGSAMIQVLDGGEVNEDTVAEAYKKYGNTDDILDNLIVVGANVILKDKYNLDASYYGAHAPIKPAAMADLAKLMKLYPSVQQKLKDGTAEKQDIAFALRAGPINILSATQKVVDVTI